MIAAGVAIWSAAVASVATWAVIRPRAADAPSAPSAPLLLFRPCAGTEPHLGRALLSSRHVGSTAAVRLLVADFGDGAWPVAVDVSGALAADGQDARVVMTGARGPNKKADQLARALANVPAHPDEIVIVADSDVLLDERSLRAVVDPVAGRRLDACWAPPIEIAPSTEGDRLSKAVLEASLHAFPLLGALDPRCMVGKLFAVRREALAAIGGFERLVAYLGDDMELGRRLHSTGFAVGMSSTPAGSLASGRAVKSVVDRYTRWIAVIRAQRPWLLPSYPLLFFATPLQIALALGALPAEGLHALSALFFALATRVLVAMLARKRAGQVGGVLVPAIGADLLLLLAFVRALVSRRVSWRGTALATNGPTVALAKDPR